jgi:isopentenyl-diphosphate delta-isomerase
MIGYYNDEPQINQEEVEYWKWMSVEAIKQDMLKQPEIYTVWFKIIFDEFYHFLEEHTV